MPLLYLLFFMHFTVLHFPQKETRNPESSLQRLVLAAYEREALLKSTLTEVRTRIREQLPTNEAVLEFDETFSGLVKRDVSKKVFSKEIQGVINQILPLDSLMQLITNWQRYRLQSLRLLNHSLTEENLSTPDFNNNSKVVQYLSFFDIQSKDKVAELGAGSGWLSMLLCILYDSVALHINELGDYNMLEVKKNFLPTLTKAQLARCHFAVGSKNSTALETEELDLIIAVDVFHHFTDKASMLQSIKWSLAKGGRLCLVEQMKTIGTSDYYCPQAMEQWELEAMLLQNGFVKTKEHHLLDRHSNNIYLLEYRVNPL